jgi:DNA-binding LytR/AlgR family response regulator
LEYSYLIIDSDAISNLQLNAFLEDYGDFNCLGLAKSTEEGINSILKFNPNIVFINLNNEARNLFQMVMELHQYITDMPVLIGLSKSKDYAYEAIKNGFYDYWLQPYNEFDIRKSLLKLKKQMPKKEQIETICLKSYKDYHYLDTRDILYLKADNNTTEFIMKDGSVNHAYKTLKTFEEQLPDNFIRIHQSYIVNTAYITRINFGKSICGLKSVSTPLPFSKSYKDNLDQLKKILSKNALAGLN